MNKIFFKILLIFFALNSCKEATFSSRGKKSGGTFTSPTPTILPSPTPSPSIVIDPPTITDKGVVDVITTPIPIPEIKGGEITKFPLMPIKLTGNRHDGSDKRAHTYLKLKNANGDWQKIMFPDEEKTVFLNDVCSQLGETVLDIAAGDDSGEEQASSSKCFVGLPRASNVITLGFERKCSSGTRYQSIDDSIVSLACPGPIRLNNVRIDMGINMQKWVDGLFSSGYVGY